MTMQYDVKATAIAAAQTDAAVFAGPARIKGMVVSVPAAGGTLLLKDGAAGTTRFSFVAPAVLGAVNIVVPGEGIRCDSGIYATTPAGMTVTVFYG
jgi:hypothetical protein